MIDPNESPVSVLQNALAQGYSFVLIVENDDEGIAIRTTNAPEVEAGRMLGRHYRMQLEHIKAGR